MEAAKNSEKKSSAQQSDKKQRCAKHVHNGGRSVTFHLCVRDGTIFEDGKWWCWQHSPSAEKTRQELVDKKDEAEWAKFNRRRRIQNAETAVVKAAERWVDLDPTNSIRATRALIDSVAALRKARKSS